MNKKLLTFTGVLFTNYLFSYSPIIIPEWSLTLNSSPKQMILYDIEGDRLAEIVIAKIPNQVMLLTNTGDSILWNYQTRSMVTCLSLLQGSNPLLVIGDAPYVEAIDNKGIIHWQLFINDLTNKSINWLLTGNFDITPGNEIILGAKNLIYVLSITGRIIHKFTIPILPKQVETGNIDNDIYDEIVVSDFSKILAFEADGNIKFQIPLTDFYNQTNRAFDLYDFTLDRIVEILAITQAFKDTVESKVESWITCFSTNGKVLWQTKENAGIPRALRIVRGEIFTIGSNQSGQDYITKRDRNGKVWQTIYYSNNNIISPIFYTPEAKISPNPIDFQELYSIGNKLLIGLGWHSDVGPPFITSLRLFSNNLDEIKLFSPDYFSTSRIITADQGEKIDNITIGSINGDTLLDLLVVREKGEGNYAIDCLINHTDILFRAEQELWNSYNTALENGDYILTKRLERQAKILASSFGDILAAVRTESFIRRTWRRKIEIAFVRSFLIAILIIAILGGFGLIVIRPLIKKKLWNKTQIETKSIPSIVRIATDIIALDHNYVVKGNLSGAYNRLKDIMSKYQMNNDRDLEVLLQKNCGMDSVLGVKLQPADFQIPYYRFIKRLSAESRTINIIAVIKKICQNLLDPSVPIKEIWLNRKEYITDKIWREKNLKDNELSVSFIYLVNRDFPDIYNLTRIFWNSRLYNWFEHICGDHLRYAKHNAEFVFDYETATEWSRKLVIHLVSDSEKRIDYNQRDSHLQSEFEEIKIDFQDYILVPDNELALYYPNEKIWIKIVDLISILSTIIHHSKGI